MGPFPLCGTVVSSRHNTGKSPISELQSGGMTMPRQIQETLSIPNFEISRMTSLGPGDEDINSKSGRQTHVEVTTGPITVEGNGSYAQFVLVYRIMEGRSDFTTLEWRDN